MLSVAATSGVLWLFLAAELLVRQVHCLKAKDPFAFKTEDKDEQRAEDQEGSVLPLLELVGEAGSFIGILLTVGLFALSLALAVDTTYDYLSNQAPNGGRLLPALSLISFLHKNIVLNLSIFYGDNAWHFYLTQGLPVLCTTWLPATLFGLITAMQTPLECGARTNAGDSARRSLAKLVWLTVGLYSLLGHKEFRFLQPLLPAPDGLGGYRLADSYASSPQSTTELRQKGSP